MDAAAAARSNPDSAFIYLEFVDTLSTLLRNVITNERISWEATIRYTLR